MDLVKLFLGLLACYLLMWFGCSRLYRACIAWGERDAQRPQRRQHGTHRRP
jgi:hypothetical protein